jgi:Hypothetical protein (DUF2513)
MEAPNMTRDMELIRQIALQIEESADGWAPESFSIDGYTEAQIGYHVLFMIEGGLVQGEDVTSLGGPPHGIASRLTWAGHEFLDAAREPTRWERTKALLAKAGGASFPVWMEALTKAAIQTLGS